LESIFVTEDEWLAPDVEPQALLDWASHITPASPESWKRDQRLKLLLGCACCRLIDAQRLGSEGLAALDAMERDGAVWPDVAIPNNNVSLSISEAIRRTSERSIGRVFWRVGEELGLRDHAVFRPLVRCIYGNPFRPFLDTEEARRRIGEKTIAIARAIDARFPQTDPDAFDVIGDALEEANLSTYAAAHCRDRNISHVRGCHVIDGLLGRR